MQVLLQSNDFIITKGQANSLILWEKVKKADKHIVFQHFGDQLYARYDSMHTPTDCGISVKEWHRFMRAEAGAIVRKLMKACPKRKGVVQ